MRFLVGQDNGKTCATITTSKEEIDYQFQYPGRNQVIKKYFIKLYENDKNGFKRMIK